MSKQLPKDPVTLADLKRAIEAVPAYPPKHSPCELYLNHADNLSEAWRTAFEWLNAHHGPFGCDDYNEGMALIREKLQS